MVKYVKCVLNLNIMKRLSSKNEIICDKSLTEIKSDIKVCIRFRPLFESEKKSASWNV